MRAFSAAEAESHMGLVPGWQFENYALARTFEFESFREALAFVNRLGELAEEAGHHPDIDIRTNRVRLVLTTHDAGGLTERDFDLAGKAGKLA